MTTGQIIRTVIEVLLAVAIILGIIFEPKIAKWEKNFFMKLKRKFTIRIKK